MTPNAQIKQQRLKMNLTMQDVSELTGISQSSLSRYEAEQSDISSVSFIRLIHALNFTRDEKIKLISDNPITNYQYKSVL